MRLRDLLRRTAFGLCAAAATMAVPAACASPWTRAEGRLFVSTKTNYFAATADAPLAGAIDPPRYERFGSDVYAEYGVVPNVMLVGKVIYGDANYYDGFKRSDVGGFAEFELGAQYSIFRRDRDALAVKLAAATPTRFENGGRPGAFSDGVDLELRALYGRTLIERPVKVFATAEAAYRRRFGDGADQARGDLLVGIAPLKRALILIEAQSRISLRNENPGGADYDVVILQPSAVWRVSKRWSAQAGIEREIAGRGIERGEGYFIGLWTEF